LILASAGSLTGAAVQATKKRPGWLKRALLWLGPAIVTAALGGLASFGAGIAQARYAKPSADCVALFSELDQLVEDESVKLAAAAAADDTRSKLCQLYPTKAERNQHSQTTKS
jgi:hypothetical protein